MLKPLRQGEFVALMAVLFATVAVSIDAMLPALPEIAASLSPDAPNQPQLVITSFVFGMGVGTLFVGPLADAYGRKPVMVVGAVLYILGALLCYAAPSLDILLAARVLQGLGAAAPRIAGTAMIRDQYQGPDMARVLSFVMMIFTLAPAVGPLIGQGIIHLADWHGIFLAYVAFSLITTAWLVLRQPETLAAKRPLSLGSLWSSLQELSKSRIVMTVTLAQSFILAALFATLSSMHGIFEQQFDRADSFPLWFGLIALASALGSFLNAKIVMRLGMRRVVIWAVGGMLVLTLAIAATHPMALPQNLHFALHILWSVGMFSLMGLSMGNLNALAMEPMGYIAGMAASAITSISTVISVALAVPVGLAFDGTALPLYLGVAAFMALTQITLRFVR
jgi:MFS transporter, DHA1 family, multidrug resistance protein